MRGFNWFLSHGHAGKVSGLAFFAGTVLAVSCILAIPPASLAGGVEFSDGNKWVEFGGRIQVQYHITDPDGGDSTDEFFFRRLRPYIEGSIHPDWKGKFQFDYGKAEDDSEISIKDAYLAYGGLSMMNVKVGNALTPFSRETLTSSKRQQLVERTFVGDHNYGSPDRNLGVHLSGSTMDKKLGWGLSGAQACIDPDTAKLDFDTPVNRNSDFNDGWILGGRVDFHPFGYLKMAQGDFERDLKATVSLAAFTWSNDDDNNSSPGKDVDSVTGFEISGAYRYMGFSVDAQYNIFDAELVDAGVTEGLYENSETELKNWAIEGGYMLPGNSIEFVAAYESQDADNYEDTWTRTSVGANYFFTRNHDIKLQATYRMGENLKGVRGKDGDDVFVQMQYVF